MIPRDYQLTAVEAAVAKTASVGRTLLALPCAAGKTAIAGFYIEREAVASGSRFLVIQHTDELIQQNRATIDRITGLPSSIVKAEKNDWSGRVVFGSVQTLARNGRRQDMPPFSHLIIDEAHHAAAVSYQAIIDHALGQRRGCKLLGLSATPERGDGRSLRETFDNIGYHLPIGTLIKQGLLVPPKTLTVSLGVDKQLAAIKRTAADFDMQAADAILNCQVLNEAVVDHWKKHASDRRTVAFCTTIDHAAALAKAFQDAGIEAELVSGEMAIDERRARIAALANGELQLLTNCMVLTEGWDDQGVGCIIVLRPMLHKSTFIQAVGRGLRRVDPERFPGVVKTDCIILDFTGAAQRHGSIEAGLSLDGDECKPKECPECGAEVPKSMPECPFCGYVWAFQVEEAEEKTEKTVLERFELAEIDLLNASPFRWCDLFADDQSLIASGFDAWGGIFYDGTHWHAIGKEKGTRVRHLSVGPRVQALAAANDYMRERETSEASRKSRRWLQHPATDRQRELLYAAGSTVDRLDFGLSKYAANCMLNFLWNKGAIKRVVFA